MFWLTEKVYFVPGHCWSHVVLVTDFPVSKSPILENYLSYVALVSVIIKTFLLFKPSLILDIVFTVWNGLKTLRPCQTEEINSGGGGSSSFLCLKWKSRLAKKHSQSSSGVAEKAS